MARMTSARRLARDAVDIHNGWASAGDVVKGSIDKGNHIWRLGLGVALKEGSDVARREGRHASPRPERGRRDVGNDRRVLALGQAFMRPKKEGQKRERDESDPRSLPEIWGVMGRGWEWHETHQAS